MEVKVQQNVDQAARLEACRNLLKAGTGWQHMATESDIHRLAELILHAMDETVNHMLDHVKRVKFAGFQNPQAEHMMLPMLLKLMSAQIDGMIADGLKQILAGAMKDLKPISSIDELFSELEKELGLPGR